MYNHKTIEKKWREKWKETDLYKTGEDRAKPKYYILDMFPYPSGAGLHVGHPKGYIATDIFARMKKMRGFNVLHPMGWDAFGLPAENFAIKNKVHPEASTRKNIETFKGQLEKLGFSYDWDREINTTDPGFYKWTQWVFLEMFKRGLAYESYEPIIWCPSCKTGLSNEDLEGGKCERCGSEVERKPMRQWVLKITDYADRLLYDLEKLPHWEESIKEMQRNWIGRSEGARVKFQISNSKYKIQNNAKEYFKFRSGLIKEILKGRKWVTFRLEAKDVKAGDVVSIIDWAEGVKENQKEKCLAVITKIDIKKIKDLPLDYPGHEKYGSYDEMKNKLGEYYGKGVNDDTVVYIYEFAIEKFEQEVFTTRPDTLFGATYFVMAPEHPLVEKITAPEQREAVNEYVIAARKKSEMERTELSKEKTGVYTGAYAVNPVNGEKIPVWIADYVMMGYGTGAIMAVPAHDERDFEFAKKFGIEIKEVVAKETGKSNGKEIKKRGGCAIVFDPDQQKYAVIKREDGLYAFYSGGANEDESLDDCVRRELEEESGFHNFRSVENLVHAYTNYYNSVKKHRVCGLALCNLCILKDADRLPLKLEDHEKGFETIWASPDEIMDNWQEHSCNDGSFDHWRWFLKLAVARLKERGIDNQEYRYSYEHEVFTGDGRAVNSGFLDGLKTAEAKEKIIKWLEEKGLGERAVNYKIKDWVFSRQRYWGEPIPVIHCEKCGVVGVPEEDLPVKLPEVEHYEPTGTGESPLANIRKWVETKCPKCGGPGKRETNTMPQWAGSSWYYLRFIDPHNDKALVDKEKEKYWSPVDFYVGGAEHATRHLIYSRFWHKFLFDLGAVNYDEPFTRLQHVGLIMAEDGRKMSKRWGNVINPDDIVERFGADAMRVYEMFMGPFSQSCAWSTNGLIGARKFLERVWKLKDKAGEEGDQEIERLLHKTVKKVGEDIEGFKLNTAVSAMMILSNEMEKRNFSKSQYKRFITVLSPFAPHLAEEINSESGSEKSIFESPWPEYDSELAKDEVVTLVLQVNGKIRGRIEVPAGIEEKEAKRLARESESVKQWIGGREIAREIYVPGKLVNIVLK